MRRVGARAVPLPRLAGDVRLESILGIINTIRYPKLNFQVDHRLFLIKICFSCVQPPPCTLQLFGIVCRPINIDFVFIGSFLANQFAQKLASFSAVFFAFLPWR
jgi:hypothetical protein